MPTWTPNGLLRIIGPMEPMIVNILSALGTILGVWAAGYTLYEHIRDARNREAAKSTARP